MLICEDKPGKIEEKAKGAQKAVKEKLKKMRSTGSEWMDIMMVKWGLYNEKGVLIGKDLSKAISGFSEEARNRLNSELNSSLIQSATPGGAYQSAKSKLQEIYANASPDKKAWIRQNAQKLLAGGEQTASALAEMGNKFKDATMEGAKKVGDTVNAATSYATTTITNSVSSMSGGGGGGSNKLLNEQTMDDIATGHVMY